MNWKLALLTGLVTPLIAVSCNSNPVNVPSGVDTPMLFSQDPTGGLQKVDLLWMIDDSGSMAEEQLSVIKGISPLAQVLQKIDFHIAVVSTQDDHGSSQKTCLDEKTGKLGQCHMGQFHSAADLTFSSLAAGGLGSKPTKGQAIKGVIKQVGKCVKPNPTVLASLDTYLQSVDDTAGITTSQVADLNNYLSQLEPLQFGPVLKREDYLNQDGSFDLDKLKRELGCLTLVGTNGYGIEKGLGAVVKAVSKNGPNKKYNFVREDSSMVVVLVSDENDCSHEPVACPDDESKKCDFNDNSCGTAVCNYYNHADISESKYNPLLSPKIYAQRFLDELRELKNDQEFDKVSAVAITGGDLPQPGKDKEINAGIGRAENKTVKNIGNDVKQAIKKLSGVVGGTTIYPESSPVCKTHVEKEMTSCDNSFGKAVAGDRYYRFIRQFPSSYPKSSDSLGDSGAICVGDNGFTAAFQAIGKFALSSSGDCISRPLLKCKPSQSPGDKCGPEGIGECTSYPQDGVPPGAQQGDLFCSASVDLVASGKLADINGLKSKGLCIGDVVENGENASCSIKIEKFKACNGGGGVTYEVSKPAALASGVKLDLRFTGFDVESDGKSDK